MNDLITLLREQAADDADFTTPQNAISWEAGANSAILHVQAATRKLSTDQGEAWHAATEMRDAIMALGYKLHGTCQVGIVSEIGPEDPNGPGYELPICGWRGLVSLNMRPSL